MKCRDKFYQTSTANSSHIDPKCMKCQCKFYQHSTANASNIDPKSIKMRVRRHSGGGLTKRPPKVPLWDASVIDFGSQNGGQIEGRINQKMTSFLKRFLMSLFEYFLWIWTSLLEYFLILFRYLFRTCGFFDF